MKLASLANAGQECPAYRDRRGFLTPLDAHLPNILPRIAVGVYTIIPIDIRQLTPIQ